MRLFSVQAKAPGKMYLYISLNCIFKPHFNEMTHTGTKHATFWNRQIHEKHNEGSISAMHKI